MDLRSYHYRFGPGNDHEIRVASSLDDRRKAWRLVYNEYRKKGYADPDPEALWYGLYDALPETTTFLVEKNGEPVAALTIVFDSAMGLPADDLFPEEMAGLRQRGRRLCEMISLAHGERAQSLLVLKHMFKLAYITAWHVEKATDFILTCTPTHSVYYERQLLFDALGGPRPYGKVNGTPGVILRLNLLEAEERYRQRFDSLMGERNAYRFFVSHVPELRAWLAATRGTLDPEAVAEYFTQNPRFAGNPNLDLARRIAGRALEAGGLAEAWTGEAAAFVTTPWLTPVTAGRC
jgi:hypothetical protein